MGCQNHRNVHLQQVVYIFRNTIQRIGVNHSRDVQLGQQFMHKLFCLGIGPQSRFEDQQIALLQQCQNLLHAIRSQETVAIAAQWFRHQLGTI